MLTRLLIWIWALVSLAVLALLEWGGPVFGHSVFTSQFIAMRAPITLIVTITWLIAIVVALFHRRPQVFVACGLVALLLAVNIITLVQRGYGSSSTATAAQTTSGANDLRILSWNTTPTGVSVADIAALALRMRADVISLPETPPTRAAQIATAMRAGGSPMWVVPPSTDASKYPMSMLVAKRLQYSYVPDYSLTVRGGVIAAPTSSSWLPEIITVHTQQPGVRPSQDKIWQSHLAWLRAQCARTSVVLAGDFNGTVDNYGAVGACTSSQNSTSLGTGTWPTSLPTWLGAPIDHVMASGVWQVSSFTVIDDHDTAGSDHRPVFAIVSHK